MQKRAVLILLLICLSLTLSGCKAKGGSLDAGAAPNTGGGIATPTIDPHAGMIEVSDGTDGTIWITPNENISVNTFSDENYYYDDSGVLCYEDNEYTVLHGIDVSRYQGTIDWTAVAAAGIDFVIVRAGYRGYSGGSTGIDEQFLQNVDGATAAGLRVGAYFFSQAITDEEAAEEAQIVIDLLGGRELSLPIFYDWEKIWTEEETRTAELVGTDITGFALTFCGEIEAAGYDAGLYFYRSLGYFSYDLEQLDDYMLWYAAVLDTSDFYYAHDIWQYSFEGTVDGIDTAVDLNLMFVRVA